MPEITRARTHYGSQVRALTMAKIRKQPYFRMAPSTLPFTTPKWKCYTGSVGCVPINTLQTISYERLAPGEVPPQQELKAFKPTSDQIKIQRADAAHQIVRAIQAAEQQHQENAKQPAPPIPKPEALEAEEREKLPEFDLQDIPGAMDNFGWPMSAKVARRWFNSPAHVWDNNLDSVQPIDDTTVTLNWALKYGSVKERLNELFDIIYSENAHAVIKKKILQHTTDAFTDAASTNPNLSFDTAALTSDPRKFHMDWHFQKKEVSIFDTTEGILVMTDLSGTLGNFVLYAAIGRVEVTGSRFFKYDTNPNQFYTNASAKLTHVYIYLKDNYSFNDKDPSKSQYLGHWNKKDMVMSYYLSGNDIIGQFNPNLRRQNKYNNEKIEKYNWNYFPNQKEVDKPIDTRRNLFKKYSATDVYWPVYNRSYNEWREKHKRGGDFMIYSKPQLYKLRTPIVIELGTICRPYDNTSKNRQETYF